MNQQIAYLSQLKQTMELYQFMVKLCWLKTLLDAQVDEHGRSTAASAGSTGVVKKKSASGAKKIEAKPCQEKSTCKSLSRQEKSKVSTIDTSEVIKGRMYDFNNGRFLSVDPFIQGTSSQAINPYSYIQNNPLSGVDPTGYVSNPLDDGSCGITDNRCGKGMYAPNSGEYWKAYVGMSNGATQLSSKNRETIEAFIADIGNQSDVPLSFDADEPSDCEHMSCDENGVHIGNFQYYNFSKPAGQMLGGFGQFVEEEITNPWNYFGGGVLKAGSYLIFRGGKVFKVERTGEKLNDIKAARGLSGTDFEDWIKQNLGGTGEFKAAPPSNRKIDGILPDGTWYEAKSSFNYLFHLDGTKNLDNWSKFTSQVSDGNKAAKRAGANYEIITNTAPPVDVVNWANKHDINIKMVE